MMKTMCVGVWCMYVASEAQKGIIAAQRVVVSVERHNMTRCVSYNQGMVMLSLARIGLV
jgi:hypothetical protein